MSFLLVISYMSSGHFYIEFWADYNSGLGRSCNLVWVKAYLSSFKKYLHQPPLKPHPNKDILPQKCPEEEIEVLRKITKIFLFTLFYRRQGVFVCCFFHAFNYFFQAHHTDTSHDISNPRFGRNFSSDSATIRLSNSWCKTARDLEKSRFRVK